MSRAGAQMFAAAFVAVAAAGLNGGCGSSSDSSSSSKEDELASLELCRELNDHMVNLRLQNLQGLSPEQISQQRSALIDSLQSWPAQCSTMMTAASARCQLAAKTSDQLAACSTSATSGNRTVSR